MHTTIGIDESKIIAGCSLNSAIAGRAGIFLAVGFKKGLDDRITAYRTAFLIAMTGFFLVGWAVDFWDAAYVLFLFLMGSGVWILDVEAKERAVLRLPPQPARYRAN